MTDYKMGVFRMILKSEPYISDSELKEALLGALEGRQLNKVLLLPPDYTRLYSGAGKIIHRFFRQRSAL